MRPVKNGYLTSKARSVAGSTGRHYVAAEQIAAGEVVAAFGGRCISRAEFDQQPVRRRMRGIQIDDELFLSGAIKGEPSNSISHSCDPNCGMRGNTILVARRPIEKGEKLSYDYAMTNGTSGNEFDCSCGSPLCRGRVTGNDWTLPELQLRYRGNFSPYLAARIAALVFEGAERRAFSY